MGNGVRIPGGKNERGLVFGRAAAGGSPGGWESMDVPNRDPDWFPNGNPNGQLESSTVTLLEPLK